MKCIELNTEIDICVTVTVKLIEKKAADDSLSEALQKKENSRQAQFIGAKHEESIAEEIKKALSE
jgi:hypothetical protein